MFLLLDNRRLYKDEGEEKGRLQIMESINTAYEGKISSSVSTLGEDGHEQLTLPQMVRSFSKEKHYCWKQIQVPYYSPSAKTSK